MNNIFFIQFYSKYHTCLSLSNGFSDAYNYCKTLGSFLWVDDTKLNKFKIPIEEGTVYISSVYPNHLIQSIIWSKQYPNINFISGGPAISTNNNLDIDIPDNLKLTKKTVEDYFNIPTTSENWNLDITDIKDEAKKYNKILFSYTIDTSCYWKKCTFCNYHYVSNSINKKIELSPIDNIDFDGIKQVRLNTPSITSKQLKDIFKKITYKKNMIYDILMRCDKSIYTTLDYILKNIKGDIPNLKFRLGIEFPSNRMLNYMKKGFSVDDILNTIKILNKYKNIKIYTMFMVGWPILNRQDIDDLKYFSNEISDVTLEFISIHRTFCCINTELFDQYKDDIEKHSYVGNLYRGYFPKLNKKQLHLNKKAIDIIRTIKTKNLSENNTEIIMEIKT